MVSLGTGLVPVSELKEIDVFRPDSFFDAAKLAYGISAIGKREIKIINHQKCQIYRKHFRRHKKDLFEFMVIYVN